MKFLLVLLLAGLGLAAAVPLSSHDVELQHDSEDNSFKAIYFDDEGDDVAQNLRERLREILEKIKDAFENRKTVGANVLAKLKEIYDEMREKSIPLGDKIKEVVEQLREKATGLWKRILDRISGDGKRSIDDLEYLFAEDDEGDEVAQNLRERLREILEKIKDAFENRKTIGANVLAKLKEIYDEMREKSIPLGDKIKEVIEQLREKATGLWKIILDRISGESKRSIDDLEFLFAENEGDEVAQNLRERLREILEKIKDAFENRKTIGANVLAKLKEIYDEMREKSIPLGDKIKEVVEQLREKATGLWKRILDRISGDGKRSIDDLEYLFAEDEGDEVAQNLRERLREILEKIKDAFENRKTIGANVLAKLKEIYDEMREKSIPLGDKIKEVVEQLREKATGLWKRILDRISGDSKRSIDEFEYLFAEDEEDEVAQNLRERLREILEKIKDAFENRKTIGANVLAKLKEIYDEMREKSIPLGDKIKEVVEQLREKATGLWKRILDRISGDSKRSIDEFEYLFAEDEEDEVAQTLRERLRELLEKVKDAFENRKTIGTNVLAKLKEVYEQMKEKSIPLGDRVKEIVEQLREKATGLWKRILDRISGENYIYAEEKNLKELGKKLRAHFDEILDKLNDIVENGKALKEDYVQKLKEIRQKLRDIKQDISDHAKELLGKLKEKGKEYWKKIFDKLRPGSDADLAQGPSAEDLRNQLTDLLEKLKDAFRNKKVLGGGFVSKLRELRDKFREGNIPLGSKLKEMISDLKEKATGLWKRILEKFDKNNSPANELALLLSDDDIKTELGKRLKEKFDEILEKVKESIESGKTVKEDTLNKLKEIREQLRDLKVDIGEKAKNLIENLKEKAKDYWKKILDKLRE